MKLPTHNEAREAVELQLATPLDKFIYDYEPEANNRLFRDSLGAMLEYWRTKDDPVITQLDATLPLPFLTDDPE